jgi:Tfp pilus assembly protein PilF
MMKRLFLTTITITLLSAASALAQRQQSVQVDLARERARPAYEAGLEHLRAEKFDAALKSFQDAIELDPEFDMAYYMLGRTHMMTKSYTSAVAALAKCRDLHLAESSSDLLTKQELQSIRRRRVDEITDRINDLQAALDAGGRRDADRIRTEIQMLRERKRQIEDAERQLTPERAVPSYVSLALGSAYFRSGKLAEAERAYLATVAADPKVGEAHSNLAVVYMETGRFADAEKAVEAAEKTGFRVAPALKAEIKKRKSGTL